MSQLETVELESVGRIVTGKTPPSSIEGAFGGDVPFITPSDMDGRKWIDTTDRYLTEIGVSTVRSSLVPRGAVAVSCIGSDMGKVVMVAKDSVTNQQINSIIVDEARYVPEYIYYALLPRQKELKDLASGSATPILSKGLFSKVTADVLPFHSQKAIAEILSSLDEKIELNRKQNLTLEAIAQALFKRWFVEFEFPDENGRPYQSSGGAMQPSELGEIPAGWRAGKLEELIGELETGSRPKGGVGMFTDGIPSVGAESITRIGEYDYAKTKYVPEEYFAKMRRGVIKDRDVLIYKDGGTPGRFDVRISMFGGGFPFEVACINEHVFRVQAKKPIYQNYLYLWFSSYPVLEELRHRGAKAAIPGINSNDVKELDFLFMDEVVLEKFDEVIEPLFAKLLRNSREMAALARLRDALLPKLMSGELRVA